MPEKTKVLILGASGMLGGMLCRVLGRDPALEVTATVRGIAFDDQTFPGVNFIPFYVTGDYEPELESILRGFQYVINAIGIIKPLIHLEDFGDAERALRINSVFPFRLAHRSSLTQTEVIQIATDCVFSGADGSYSEDDEHDALDVYAKTKSLGEVSAPHVYNLRCSIVGPDWKRLSLLEWTLGHGPHSWIRGFNNHFWNGLTTYHFARICRGIARYRLQVPRLQHVIPADRISKCELLRLFAQLYERTDLMIEEFESDVPTDRTLQTTNHESNEELWLAAGYDSRPTIHQMIKELAEAEPRLGYWPRKVAA
jgi:dTDP-4-dehydrorhamnose reductase